MSLKQTLTTMGGHEKRIRRHFGRGNLSFRGSEPLYDEQLVIVAFKNRSGSNLLCDYLRNSGQVRTHFEALNHEPVVKHAKRLGLKRFPDYFEFLRSNKGQGKRRDCVKASWDQLLMLLRFGIHNLYSDVRVVHITRSDIVSQAVSYALALQTKQWASFHDGEMEDGAAAFDAATIDGFLDSVSESHGLINLLCAAAELPYHTLRYEDLVAYPDLVLMGCGQFLGFDLKVVRDDALRFTKQESAVKDAHRARYLTDLRERAGFEV